MKHIHTVSRAGVREAQTATDILSILGTILSIITAFSGIAPLFRTK